jgi:hypothetical protein
VTVCIFFSGSCFASFVPGDHQESGADHGGRGGARRGGQRVLEKPAAGKRKSQLGQIQRSDM